MAGHQSIEVEFESEQMPIRFIIFVVNVLINCIFEFRSAFVCLLHNESSGSACAGSSGGGGDLTNLTCVSTVLEDSLYVMPALK